MAGCTNADSCAYADPAGGIQLALHVYTAIVPQSGAASSPASISSSLRSCGITCRSPSET